MPAAAYATLLDDTLLPRAEYATAVYDDDDIEPEALRRLHSAAFII